MQLESFAEKFILGGGSNILLTQDIEALVLHMAIMGIYVEEEDEDHVVVRAKAGENWHELVIWSLENNFGGLENLSLIPGCVGTSPIQNIGAYGVELTDVFMSCEAMHLETLELVEFTKEECQFGYRDSIFKNEAKGKYVITSVALRLTKKNHQLYTQYGAIDNMLQEMGIVQPSIQNISEAVIKIRQSKLPDPKEIGNSGSFFKNPVLGKKQFNSFRKNFPEAPFYELEDTTFKVPAGWLVEQAGFKGKRFGDAGVHENQALVLVNYGNATGMELVELSDKIKTTVKDKFDILLETEVNIIR